MGYYVVDVKIVIPVYLLVGIVCILANAWVCYVIIRRKVPNVIKYYIFSLAITDILVGVVCIPLYLLLKWISFNNQTSLLKHINILRSVLLASVVLLLSSSMLHLCLMAFDRAMAISKPFYHRRKLQLKSTALKLLIIPWLLALVNAILFQHFFTTQTSWGILVAVAIIFPSCFLVSCYLVLLHKIRSRNLSFKNQQNMQQINERRIIKKMLAVTVIFAICWMPSFAFSVYYVVNIKHLPPYIQIFLEVSSFMQYLNSACNPFIYAVFNPAFRTATTTTSRSMRRRTKSSSSNSNTDNANVDNNATSMETNT